MNELKNKMAGIFDACLELAMKKNKDYSSEADALQNFRCFGSFGIGVRLSDKMIRAVNIFKGHVPMIQEEQLDDTLMDIINYAALAMVMREEERNERFGCL